MKLSLQIMMGLNCNFTCGHCLNDSGPGQRQSDLSGQDIESILSAFQRHPNISAVGFSGGEPLLYLDQIEALLESIEKIRPLDTLSVSMTSNGSLISKYSDRLKRQKIDGVLLSYDRFHREFMSPEEFADAVILSQELFKKVEINLVLEEDQDLDLVKEVALKHDIKVQISRPVKSGRYNAKTETAKKVQFKQLKCPNIPDQYENLSKISYFPGKGYSLCCGPLIFDHHQAEDVIAFPSIDGVLDSAMFKVLKKSQEIFLKTDESSDCDSCTNIFKKKIVKKHLTDFVRENSWDNFYSLTSFTSSELNDLDSLFQPKFVFSTPKGSLAKNKASSPKTSYKTQFSSNLSLAEIKQASDFTRDSFYGVHEDHYFESDLQRFYSDQEYFFSLPLQSVRHFDQQGQLVAFLVIGRIDDHPHFKESVWHVGYWGMASSLSDRAERTAIKQTWLELLAKANEEHRIVSCVDYFNDPAIKMADKFGLTAVGFRLDPRV